MADQQAIEDAVAGYTAQTELEIRVRDAVRRDKEYQTDSTQAAVKTALADVVEQDLKNDALTDRAVEFNPHIRETKNTMTEEQAEYQAEGPSEIEALHRKVADLQEIGASLSERTTATNALAAALAVEQRQIDAVNAEADREVQAERKAIKDKALDGRLQAKADKQAKRDAWQEANNPSKEWYE